MSTTAHDKNARACNHPPLVDTWTEKIWKAVGEQNADGLRCIASVLRDSATALDRLASDVPQTEPPK